MKGGQAVKEVAFTMYICIYIAGFFVLMISDAYYCIKKKVNIIDLLLSRLFYRNLGIYIFLMLFPVIRLHFVNNHINDINRLLMGAAYDQDN